MKRPKILVTSPNGKCIEYTFDTGEWVSLWISGREWEYQQGDDDDTYMSGGFFTDDDNPNVVVDYDGCYDLPLAVRVAIERWFTLDLD